MVVALIKQLVLLLHAGVLIRYTRFQILPSEVVKH
jgi:hypothetical protein